MKCSNYNDCCISMYYSFIKTGSLEYYKEIFVHWINFFPENHEYIRKAIELRGDLELLYLYDKLCLLK